MFNLGAAYSVGKGVEKDRVQAAQWWQKASDAGDVSAMDALASAYAAGSGVMKDTAEAARWWRAAAEKGDPTGQHALALAYFAGSGVPKDLVEAYKWLHLAVQLSSPADRQPHMIAREAIGTNMTAEDMAEAQKRAREWIDAHK
jgi:TPR repeat protein